MKTAIIEVLEAPITEAEVEARLEELAKRYRSAGSLVIDVMNHVGGQADSVIERLPPAIQDGLATQTERALNFALEGASKAGKGLPQGSSWMSVALTTTMGAAGGFGGLPTALAELPVTTTVLLRVIQSIAEEHGFDASEDSVRYDCIQVFAAAGPLESDDGADLAFLSTRVLVNGAAIKALITRVAPRFGVVLGQKLAAQTVPILGAAAGAATNYAYTSYYQDMAHVQFGLRRLAVRSDVGLAELTKRFRSKLEKPKLNRAG
ncbi:EcsC family protein [Lentibacter algarum]|uniref:EcsC family protein n=1 Tax=Lentibacter algarum TaxID=576131 RepID=UPI001C07A928|nr:EcsC family protein [Lentibacter algarum]MBU2980924.1 EcsC family protein [Lentibacter algarum]